MEFTLPRSGFRMRPTVTSDRNDLTTNIFGDIEVAKTLVHDVSSEQKKRVATDAWIDAFAIDSPDAIDGDDALGLWTISDSSNNDRFVGIRGVFIAPALPDNSVATFVAVARDYWGRGVSGDSSALLCANLFKTTDFNAIYTRVWPLLTPRSEAVQKKWGFEPAGRHTLRDSFGEQRIIEVMEFELWRLANLEPENAQAIIREAATKLGQLVAEDFLSRDTVRRKILSALPPGISKQQDMIGLVSTCLETGFNNPAWAAYCLSRETWEKSSPE